MDGIIEYYALSWWTIGYSTWQNYGSTMPIIPQGNEFGLLVPWVNTGSVTATGHVNVVLVSPSGVRTEMAVQGGQDQVKVPTDGGLVTFWVESLSEQGNYTAEITLSME